MNNLTPEQLAFRAGYEQGRFDAQVEQETHNERNFCQRCGKRLGTNDWDVHTCTPPAAQQQEPVAWRVSYPNDPELGFWFAEGTGGEGCLNEPLYTSPPASKPWVGLTSNELKPICDEYRILFGYWVEDFARDIEAKLKEKNT